MREREANDVDLLRRITERDEGAVASLYDRYANRIYTLALHICRDPEAAQEVVQDVFLSAWREADKYNAQRGSVATWLFGIARNSSIDFLRKQARSPSTVTFDQNRLQSEHDRTAEVAENQLLVSEAIKILRELPEMYRQPIQLAYFQGLSQREIAEHLKIPLGTVKTRMRAAILRLRMAMYCQPVVGKGNVDA